MNRDPDEWEIDARMAEEAARPTASFAELRASLDMVLARLESNPRTEAEWRAITSALAKATRIAVAQRFAAKAREE